MEANRGSKGKGMDWEPGGSEAVSEAQQAVPRGMRRAGLTPGLGARPPTTSPPLSAESLCPRRWPSGQCSGPGDMEGRSGRGHSPATPTDGAADHPAARRARVHPAPYLVGVVFLHPSLTVILWGARDGEQSVGSLLPHPRLGQDGEGQGDWPGVRGQGSGDRR